MSFDDPRMEDLNQRVTAAIFRAESMTAGPLQREAFRAVSLIEEEIATIVPPDHLEGLVARRGAVMAALSAGDDERAMALAGRYGGEPGGDQLKLHELFQGES